MSVFKMGEVKALYTFDTKFWRMAAVAINSLMAHRADDTDITVYCMVAPRTRGKKQIQEIIEAKGGKLVWREIRRSENPYRNYDYSRWSPVIFYRLFAHRIFPDVEKLLYMDSDTLVRDDLSELYATDVTEYALGGVRDMAPTEDANSYAGKYVREFKEKYLKHDLYINSGVLLLNLPMMAQCEGDLAAVDIPLRYPDQDIINVALDGKILEMHLRYNFIPDRIVSNKFKLVDVKHATKKPAIYHFYAVKPFLYHIVPRNTYEVFARAALEVGFYPEDFITQGKRTKNSRQRTAIPFVTLDKYGSVRFLGMYILRNR